MCTRNQGFNKGTQKTCVTMGRAAERQVRRPAPASSACINKAGVSPAPTCEPPGSQETLDSSPLAESPTLVHVGSGFREL